MKYLLRVLFSLLLLLLLIPFCIQYWGIQKCEIYVKKTPNVRFSNTYAKGWSYLETSKKFPFWRSRADKYQESFLLQTKILMFEDLEKCQWKVEGVVRYLLMNNGFRELSDSTLESTQDSFFHWRQKRPRTIESLPELLKSDMIATNDSLKIPIIENWSPFLVWSKRENISIRYLDSIPSSLTLNDHVIKLKIRYTYGYLLQGY